MRVIVKCNSEKFLTFERMICTFLRINEYLRNHPAFRHKGISFTYEDRRQLTSGYLLEIIVEEPKNVRRVGAGMFARALMAVVRTALGPNHRQFGIRVDVRFNRNLDLGSAEWKPRDQ